ncbi:hypothetical protein [Cryptosporangium sp. NPDC051539]|uniref:hypothetical protein n=1 Tax=Cryptosporangium sp. NPDC051539 TaxID=3363962 RepID=UPI0037A524EB
MTTPGPIVDEAAKFAEALLGRVGARDLSPELVERLSTAVADVAVAGAGLLRVVAEVATEWGKRPGGEEPAEPPVQHIDID